MAALAAFPHRRPHASRIQRRQLLVAMAVGLDDLVGLGRRQRAQDGQAAGAHAQRPPHADIQRQRLDRGVAQRAGRAHRLQAAPLAEVGGVLRQLGQGGQGGLAALGQAEAWAGEQPELVQQRPEHVLARQRRALEQPFGVQALQHAVAGRHGQARGRGHVAQPHAVAPARGDHAQPAHHALDALRARRWRVPRDGRRRGRLPDRTCCHTVFPHHGKNTG